MYNQGTPATNTRQFSVAKVAISSAAAVVIISAVVAGIAILAGESPAKAMNMAALTSMVSLAVVTLSLVFITSEN